ncbi:MAG: carboxypeptidase regulatory-like domain-containing protein [Acidobacteriia bacterium]|nr:carboxypeptidase regulatory-like domain-containing protein [Terriglobia bacterium]
MFRPTRVFLLVVLLVLPCFAQKKPAAKTAPVVAQGVEKTPDSAARLPVKRVVLYKNGIGYFEHTARVHGTQDLRIDFTTGQLNDVLKSLTAVDMGDGRVSSVRYNSTAPLSERLKSLRLPFGLQTTNADFLSALRGARVEVRSGTTSATGRLLSVEKSRKQDARGNFTDVTEFSLVGDAGELRTFELTPATSVRLAERDLNEEVGRYMNLIGSSRAADVRRMTLTATGSGDREIFVSYISEVPVWKSTYRILLPEKPGDKPLLQGWAVVDNTIGEDWTDVTLSLVAGAPQSFVQNISQPYYVRRPEVALPELAQLTPQTHEAAIRGRNVTDLVGLNAGVISGTGPLTGLQGFVRDPSGAAISNARITVRNEETGASQNTTTNAQGLYRFDNIQGGNSALFVDFPGFKRFQLTSFYLGVDRMNEIDARLELGSTAEQVQVTAASPTVQTENSEISSIRSYAEGEEPEAEAKGLGDNFEYKLKQKITIGKNQSALVPILQSKIEAEKVTLWTAGSSNVLRALWIKNTSGLTLDGGSFNLIDADAFAGEGVLETIHPDERRLISYAADPAVHIADRTQEEEKPVSRVRMTKGILIATQELRSTHKFVIRNADTMPRQLVVEYPVRSGWKLVDGVKPEETTANFYRFRVRVEAGKSGELLVEEYSPQDTRYELASLEDEQAKRLTLLVADNRITPALKDAMQRVLQKKNDIAQLEGQSSERKRQMDAIEKDQGRLRENMKALKGSAEERALIQRYTRELDSQEDRLAALRKEKEDLDGRQGQVQKELETIVGQIVLDERF